MKPKWIVNTSDEILLEWYSSTGSLVSFCDLMRQRGNSFKIGERSKCTALTVIHAGTTMLSRTFLRIQRLDDELRFLSRETNSRYSSSSRRGLYSDKNCSLLFEEISKIFSARANLSLKYFTISCGLARPTANPAQKSKQPDGGSNG